MGFEPTTPGTTIQCSNQLSYDHHVALVFKAGANIRIYLERLQAFFADRWKFFSSFFKVFLFQ